MLNAFHFQLCVDALCSSIGLSHSLALSIWSLIHIAAAAAWQPAPKSMAQRFDFSRWNSFVRRGHKWDAPGPPRTWPVSLSVYVRVLVCVFRLCEWLAVTRRPMPTNEKGGQQFKLKRAIENAFMEINKKCCKFLGVNGSLLYLVSSLLLTLESRAASMRVIVDFANRFALSSYCAWHWRPKVCIRFVHPFTSTQHTRTADLTVIDVCVQLRQLHASSCVLVCVCIIYCALHAILIIALRISQHAKGT